MLVITKISLLLSHSFNHVQNSSSMSAGLYESGPKYYESKNEQLAGIIAAGSITTYKIVTTYLERVHGLFVPWTFRTLDYSYRPRLFVPFVPTVPWTIRTIIGLLDYSYRRRFVHQ